MEQEAQPQERIDEAAARLEEQLQEHSEHEESILRTLMMTLHRRGIVSIDAIQDEARTRAGHTESDVRHDPNVPQRDRWNEQERLIAAQIVKEYASRCFSVADINDLVNLAVKREGVSRINTVANLANVSTGELRESVRQFCEIPPGETRLAHEEVMGTRVSLIRHFISDQLEFIGVAKNYLQIRHFEDITNRIVGTDNSKGRIGGKAGGMLLGYHILNSAPKLSDSFLPIAIPESYYLRSDLVEEFLRLNRLDEYQSQKYKSIDDVAREYPLIRGVFRNSDFPLKIVQSLRKILGKLGTHPLIVRSSSLLEDRIGTGFYGKYASVFLPNQGTLEQRLRALLGGIAEVFASVLAPDPILYRREHNLLDYVEEMAVLIQKVVGFPVGGYFLPAFAGVAFSRNEYRWSPRIKREDGLIRLVMGLGTRAVDRSGSEYPRMVAVGNATLRPESTVHEVLRCAQRTLDVIDVNKNRLTTARLGDVLSGGAHFPMLDRLVSIYREDGLYPPTGSMVDPEHDQLCITFDKLLRDTPFPEQMHAMLRRLEDAYQCPIDIEFACDGEKMYVLQCRTQSQAADAAPVHIPTNVPPEHVIFDAHRYVRTGEVRGIEYIIYIDPADYDAVDTRQRRVAIARVVGRLNRAMERKSFVLIGPGRWGSNDVRLGVPVHYADINRCHLLIEVARQKNGFMPEVSFGTHFFQDLVEAGIHYLPLYPDIEGNRFNSQFLSKSPNVLAELLPEDADYAKEIRVIRVPAVTGGRKLSVVMDGESDQALGFLE